MENNLNQLYRHSILCSVVTILGGGFVLSALYYLLGIQLIEWDVNILFWLLPCFVIWGPLYFLVFSFMLYKQTVMDSRRFYGLYFLLPGLILIVLLGFLKQDFSLFKVVLPFLISGTAYVVFVYPKEGDLLGTRSFF